MKVRDIMTDEPKCCGPDTNLAAATELMWTNDCGVLPVMEDGKLAGIVTDRDICMALGTRNCRPAETAVKDVATREVQTCEPDDDVHTAMAIIRRAKVRRLPVVEDGKLAGILALNDIILAAEHIDLLDFIATSFGFTRLIHRPSGCLKALAERSWNVLSDGIGSASQNIWADSNGPDPVLIWRP
jgi:CBS domain-containing protein